jgi:5-methylcytosine-specific restriction endonuclease McrA
MGTIQHQEARRILPIIRSATTTNRLLTYRTVAKALGRDPDKNARTVAQMCDLLDAAAALAGVPLVALVVVRDASGDINPKAWIKGAPIGIRDKIIARSLRHRFTDDEFAAIEKALQELDGRSNRAAWALVKRKVPQDQLYRGLTEPPPMRNLDAIDDLGSDRPTRRSVSSISYSRDPRIRDEVVRRAGGRCELCRTVGFVCADGTHYLEAHHIIALANEGADRLTNVIALCPEHHREAHFGKRRDELERKMIVKVQAAEAARQRRKLDGKPI